LTNGIASNEKSFFVAKEIIERRDSSQNGRKYFQLFFQQEINIQNTQRTKKN
jgi:hypothetical protein